MDWSLPQWLSKSLASLSPVTFSDSPPTLHQLSPHTDFTANSEAETPSSQENGPASAPQQQVVEASSQPSTHHVQQRDTDPLENIELLKIIFFRLLRRFRLPVDSPLVAKVLYRIHIATSIRGELPNRVRNSNAKTIAAAQEGSGIPELDFSVRILVLGKTGVGKSATINSLLDQRTTITSAFQPATHRIQEITEGSSGGPVSYESYVTRCSKMMQHCIHEAVLDSTLENPMVLVENHPQCEKNSNGDAVLPNGQVWRSQFLLFCMCTKVLSDASHILELKNSFELGTKTRPRVPSLPRLLSWLIKNKAVSGPTPDGDDFDEIILLDEDGEDEYDQLPPIRILTKSQFEKLSKSQKNDYLDELDYRETLYLKKQLKEECRSRREKKLLGKASYEEDDNSESTNASPDAFLLPDMAVPPSFDSDCPVHRYRCLITNDQLVTRPVLDPQGWDHDVGFDGVNLETAIEMKSNLYASVSGQMSMDKKNFNIQSECAGAYADPTGPTYSVGLNVQSAGKEDMVYTIHSNTRMKIAKHNNATDCGVSLTSFGNKYYIGAKLENSVLVGRRLKLMMNAGQMRGGGQVANGGSLEASIVGTDYPVKKDKVSLCLTALSLEKETVVSGVVESEFEVMRGTRLAVNANVNNMKMGQVGIKMSSSEHLEVAVIAALTVLFGAIFRKKATTENSTDGFVTG
ncbi:Translocase of chloroplast 90, chloroplastic [Linum perenne]